MSQDTLDTRPGPEIIAVVSALNGTGKTTTVVNLAVAFAASGNRVLVIDLDPRGGSGASLILGWHGQGGTARLLTEAVITREMIAATEIPDLYLLPAEDSLGSVERRLSTVGDSRTRLAQGLETLRALPICFDIVLINCPSNLGLITLNVLVAAHWILVPVSIQALPGVPALLTAIQRLRGGMRQALRGVYLFATQCTQEDLKTALLQGYSSVTLSKEIPWSEKIQEASQYGKPVLVYAPHDPVSIAYLELASSLLDLFDSAEKTQSAPLFLPAQRSGLLQRLSPATVHRLPSRDQSQKGMTPKETMEKRIQAWLLDPSCLLYDPEEAKLHPECQVLEQLLELTHQSTPRVSAHPLPLLSVSTGGNILPPQSVAPGLQTLSQPVSSKSAWAIVPFTLFGSFLVFLLIAVFFSLMPTTLRFEMAAWLIGPEQYWNAGSTFLLRSDEVSYRELVFGTQLIGNNRNSLQTCRTEAQSKGSVVNCVVAIPPK
ncbi:chromosome partitioning protein [Gammaproteobacteria bacterium]